MFRSPVLNLTKSLFSSSHSTSKLASIQKAFLDPSKHFAMNKMPHAVYIDYYNVGQYPELYTTGSVAATIYQSQVEQILTKTLSQKYSLNIGTEGLLAQRWDQFRGANFKNKEFIEDLQENLLTALANQIFIRESRWTWPVQQEQRLAVTLDRISFGSYETVGDFIQEYNEIIEQLVSVSHFGFSPKIQQTETAQERHYFDQLNSRPTGIQALKENRTQNQTFINRILNFVHSA